MKKIIASLIVAAGTIIGASSARAEVAAAWLEGHGGMEAGNTASRETMNGLGFQLGARVLIFEAYLDRTAFGQGASVTRGVLGLRGGFGSKTTRLVLHGDLGVIDEEGGALTGRGVGASDRRGATAVLGAAVETRLAPMLLFGFGVDGERFTLPASGFAPAVTGTDIFASLRLKFELGI